MLKHSWNIVFIGAFILTAIIFLTLVLSAPDVHRTAKDIFLGFISIYIAVLFVLSMITLVITQIKVFNTADRQEKMIMILVFIFALAYVLPKFLQFLKNR